MRTSVTILSTAALVVLGGCGAFEDMRSEYVAHRALRKANEELLSKAPRLPKVRAHLDLAYRLRRHDPRFLARLAAPYQAAGGFERAIKCYEAAERITGKPQDADIGYCLLKLRRIQSGVRHLERALKRASGAFAEGRMSQAEYAMVLNNVGYAFVDANIRLDEGLRFIEAAVAFQPLVPAYIDSLGWAHYRRGEYLDAAFYLERAARLHGRNDPEFLWHLGAVHARLGKVRRAEYELRRSLELDPSNAEAKAALRQLGRELPPPVRA